jgi:hypothetical protein
MFTDEAVRGEEFQEHWRPPMPFRSRRNSMLRSAQQIRRNGSRKIRRGSRPERLQPEARPSILNEGSETCRFRIPGIAINVE